LTAPRVYLASARGKVIGCLSSWAWPTLSDNKPSFAAGRSGMQGQWAHCERTHGPSCAWIQASAWPGIGPPTAPSPGLAKIPGLVPRAPWLPARRTRRMTRPYAPDGDVLRPGTRRCRTSAQYPPARHEPGQPRSMAAAAFTELAVRCHSAARNSPSPGAHSRRSARSRKAAPLGDRSPTVTATIYMLLLARRSRSCAQFAFLCHRRRPRP